ncbi:phosphatases II [Phellopilus nigrolimitatus]|nr:phosphatases II [Phellopilus nigrolimitatus]
MLVATHPAFADPLHRDVSPTTNQRPVQIHDAYTPLASVSVPAQMQAPTPAQQPQDGPPLVSARERLLATQLAHLASQHHASEYNRLKFGPKGSPIAYVPMSLQLPGHVKVLQERQAANAIQKAWWPSNRDPVIMPEDTDSQNTNMSTPEAEVDSRAEGDVPVAEPKEDDTGDESQDQSLPTMVSATSSDIQQEISAAISTEIPTFSASSPAHTTKTSQTHPINISMVIPFELLPAIASQLTRTSTSSPVMFRLPQNCYLDCVTAVPIPGAHTFNSFRPMNPLFLPSAQPSMPRPFHTRPPSIIWSQPGAASGELLQNALHGEFTFTLPTSASEPFSQKDSTLAFGSAPAPAPPPSFFIPSHPPLRRLMTESPPIPIPISVEIPPSDAFQAQRPSPPSPPTGVIRRLPRHERALSAPPALQPLKGTQRRGVREMSNVKGMGVSGSRNKPIPEGFAAPMDSVVPAFVVESAKTVEESVPDSVIKTEQAQRPLPLGVSLTENPAYMKQYDREGQGLMLPSPFSASMSKPTLEHRNTVPSFFAPEPPINVQRLGNLYLSSCPGKKVRLSGPVKGRGAICRDLRADLSRVKDLGVGCIVCCLDDSELDFLGASWPDYARVANELGLDVLRLPTPEGLAPLTPASLDAHLARLIHTYTLRGIPILAHCRGGVGRAGLIACCWLLKLGLCGWKDADLCARTHGTYVATPVESVASVVPHSAAEQDATAAPVPAALAQRVPVPRVCRATVQLVERAIVVVRRRRSLKAVETYEQVRFLVDFVEHLDSRAGIDCDVD